MSNLCDRDGHTFDAWHPEVVLLDCIGDGQGQAYSARQCSDCGTVEWRDMNREFLGSNNPREDASV